MVPEYRYLDNPRDERLAEEHRLLDEFCAQSDLIDYDYEKRRGGLPPIKYQFKYKVKSIIGLNPDQSPIYGEYHVAEVTIPTEYPLGGQPDCRMVTELWHPNVNHHSNNYRGRICINADALGDWHTMDMLAERIGEMLQYKNYHATHEAPFPEDAKVAEWVREIAEKRGYFNKASRHFVDSRSLLRLSAEFEEQRAKRIKKITGIVIKRRSQSGMSQEEQSQIMREASKPLTPPSSSGRRRSIVVKTKR